MNFQMQQFAPFTSDPVDLARAVFSSAESVRAGRRRILKLAVAGSVVLLAALFFVSLFLNWHFDRVWRYETAGLMGASVGTAELLSRYRDAPSFVLLSAPGIGYILINALASLAAMGLIITFGWKFGATGDAVGATQVLLAGFGAMALFRSSLLTVKAGNQDVGIGPSSVLSIMMAASDRSADRLRAADRAGRVHAIMADVSFDKAREPLPTVAVALMQNLSPADVAALKADLDALNGAPLPPQTKALLLGLKLTNVVSTAVLAAAKDSLGSAILVDPLSSESPGESKIDREIEATNEVVQAQSDDAGTAAQEFASRGLPQTPQTPDPEGSGVGTAA